MERTAGNKERYIRLMRVSEAASAANSFGLFITGNNLERIQRELAHYPTLSEGARGKRAKLIILHAEKAEARLGDEHSDVGLAQHVKWRGRRGLMASCALFAAQLSTLAIAAFKPWLTPEIIDKYHPTTIAAAAILALGAFPLRDFIFVQRFERLKERVGTLLEEIKADMRAELDDMPKRGGLGKEE